MGIPTRREGVLFVCLGNICRSPTAEAVFRATAQRAGAGGRFTIDSAGTIDWHAGNPPDWRSVSHAAKRGYDLTPLRARPVTQADFERFDWIFAMDRAILGELQTIRPAKCPGHLGLFLEFAPYLHHVDVPDPYDGSGDDFETVLDLIEAGSRSLLAHLTGDEGGTRRAGVRLAQ